MHFRTQSEGQELDVNLTPLIDVVFLLLIFFMVSTTFDSTSQLKINLPEADAPKIKNELEQLKVVINAKGHFHLNGHQLANQSVVALKASIIRLLDGDKNVQVIIQSDAQSPVQSMVTIMDVVSRLGLTNLSIQTTQSAIE
ncbi:MAG: biopolymer transporter ExbD [Gammaproteobacteria bacterium]|nr:biopolymer transporter ExbD [Gammaproteobacteria bacterium]